MNLKKLLIMFNNNLKMKTRRRIILEDDLETDENKQKIIALFNNNIKGKKFKNKDKTHCGSEGQWLEKLMNLKSNNKNEPDIFGYEMKKESAKITFGDFSASEYLFSKNKDTLDEINNKKISMSRDDFIKTFGTINSIKNRYSWSGSCVPRYGIWNSCGQRLIFNDNLDLCAMYCYSKDEREYKNIFPSDIKNKEIIIAIWKEEKLREHINKKFNKKGFFICNKKDEVYDKICFGKPFNFNFFVENIKIDIVIFDSGMYQGNSRNYSQFRSSNKFWNKLIVEEY